MYLSEYERVVCVSVDRRYEEHAPRIQRMLLDHGVKEDRLSFWLNGKGELFPRERYNQIFRECDLPRNWSNLGGYAITMAIRSVLQEAIRDKVEHLLLVEDDCELVPEFDAVLASATDQLRRLPPWDCLYYGANHYWATTEELAPNVLRCHTSFMTHCVGLRPKMMVAMLDLKVTGFMDIMMAYQLQKHYQCYALWPNIAIQQPGYSCIDETYKDQADFFRSKGQTVLTPGQKKGGFS
jgi:hypothetical protein